MRCECVQEECKNRRKKSLFRVQLEEDDVFSRTKSKKKAAQSRLTSRHHPKREERESFLHTQKFTFPHYQSVSFVFFLFFRIIQRCYQHQQQQVFEERERERERETIKREKYVDRRSTTRGDGSGRATFCAMFRKKITSSVSEMSSSSSRANHEDY